MDATLMSEGPGPGPSQRPAPRRISWAPGFKIGESESLDNFDDKARKRHSLPDELAKRHSWPKLSASRSNDDCEDPETTHMRRRSSLCRSLAQLSLDTSQQCVDITDRLEQVASPAKEEATEVLSSLARMSAGLRLELDTLQASARGFAIHRLSSFWIKSWKIVYDARRRILENESLLEQLDADHLFRQMGKEEDRAGDRLEGFRLQAFVSEVEQARLIYARTSKETREVNRFAFAEQEKGALKR